MDRAAGLRRIDRDAGADGRIATALEDRLANAGSDPATAALWRLHLARLERRIAQIRLGPPSPRAVDRDRLALRAGAILLAAVAFLAAGADWRARIQTAFVWTSPEAAGSGVRIDAWIDPPVYTGRAPIILGASAGPERQQDAISAPIGSVLVIRSSEPNPAGVAVEGALTRQDEPEKAPAAKPKEFVQRFQLRGDGKATLSGRTFAIAAIPDRPPTVELLEQPRANLRGSLGLSYTLDDDYGAIAAEARFAEPELDGRPISGRTLVPPPRADLTLPPGPNGLGKGQSTIDLSEHPWAGARVRMTLAVRDEGGNEGATPPLAIYLPQRPFAKPLARALVEQRRNLVLEPDRRNRVLAALRALMIAPDRFDTAAGVYLGLYTAATRLQHARSDAALIDVADFLWAMALQIEDGGLSEAERDLRAAEKQLREALQRNASPDEIKKLTDQLRAAMDRFMREMAEQMQRNPQQDADRTPDPNTRMVTPDELKSMVDRLEEMARNGDMAEARELLDQLQNMMENMRTARRSGRQDRAAQEMRKQLGEMDKLMRDQQQLRDDTYRDGRKPRAERRQGRDRNGQQDQSAEGSERHGQGEDQKQGLRGRQSELRDRLGEVQKRLGRRGGKAGESLDSAQDAMREADGELGEGGDREKAVDAQGRALEAMRRGADQLAREMQGDGRPSDQAGRGEGPQMGEPDGNAPDEADPLGRPSNRDPRYNPRAKYDPLGTSPALRAQRVLEELRRRLSDMSRPPEELEYLDRLIRRY